MIICRLVGSRFKKEDGLVCKCKIAGYYATARSRSDYNVVIGVCLVGLRALLQTEDQGEEKT